jgi:diadenosine tetraphosphate (Ap4A) HIT family hydrolase
MGMEKCVFCQRDSLQIIAENEMALAFYDGCPVSKGHILVIPKRHVATYFEASPEEHGAMINLIYETKKILQEKFNPDGYNIGANVGPAAGQTVFHFHIHIIPRYRGDVKDPRGGVRKVIPGRSSHPECSERTLH